MHFGRNSFFFNSCFYVAPNSFLKFVISWFKKLLTHFIEKFSFLYFAAGVLDITTTEADQFMSEMDAEIDFSSLTRALTAFETAFKSETEVGPRKDERIAETLVVVGKHLKACISRFAPESKSNYAEVFLDADLLDSSRVKLTEVIKVQSRISLKTI